VLEHGYEDPAVVEELAELAARHGVEAIMPTDHEVSLAVSRGKPTLSRVCRVLAEDEDKTQLFHDKIRALALFEEVGIPCPWSVVVRSRPHLEALSEEISYPAVLKAFKGAGSDGVWYARDAAELRAVHARLAEDSDKGDGFFADRSRLIVQEYIPGELHDVAAYSAGGALEAAMTQRRLVTVPSSGGRGIVNITTSEPQLIEHARRLAEHVGWNGVFLMDFKVDERDGVAKILEVNPRFWGTTWMAIAAGCNFPHYYIQRELGRPVRCTGSYSVGLMARYPLTEMTSVLERPFTLRLLVRRIHGFVTRSRGRDCVYDLLLSDPGPSLLQVLLWLRRILGSLTFACRPRRGRRAAAIS
jgi:predicted ATP-grasp superfamily ATP-dependent carboligase